MNLVPMFEDRDDPYIHRVGSLSLAMSFGSPTGFLLRAPCGATREAPTVVLETENWEALLRARGYTGCARCFPMPVPPPQAQPKLKPKRKAGPP